MKLKTLKDFRRPKDEEAPYTGEWAMGVNETCDNLKQEIILHLKVLRREKFYCVICEKFACDCGSSDCFKPRSEEIENWAKNFFNIIEDNLK